MRVTLYTKQGCHLCEAAREAVWQAQERTPFLWEERVLSEEDPLFERYRYEFPVLVLDGTTLFAGRIEAAALADAVARPVPASSPGASPTGTMSNE